MEGRAFPAVGTWGRMRTQTEWGWQVALYLGLSSTGAGAYLAWQVARMLDSTWDPGARFSAAFGIALVQVSALVILLDLGRRRRFYLAASRLGSSWESRGALVIAAFCGLGVLQVGGWVLKVVDWDAPLSVLMALLALAILIYGGLLLRSMRSLALWTHPLQAGLFPVSALLAGCGALALGSSGPLSSSQLRAISAPMSVLAGLEMLLLLALLLQMQRSGLAGQASARALIGGAASRSFWLGAVGLGLVVPLGLAGGVLTGVLDAGLLPWGGASALVGILFQRHVILSAAHRPADLSFRGLGPRGVGSS